MAAPNLVNVTSIIGKTANLDLTTGNQSLVDNAVGSDKVLKINTILAANVDGTNDADVSVYVRPINASPSVLYYLAKTITVPADSSLVVISKDTSFYLEEDRSLRAFASASSDIQIMCSYEEMDDA